MKAILVVAFAIVVSVNARAAFLFSDIPWNVPSDVVVKKLKAAGFKQIKRDKQGDYNFRGKLLGHEAAGVAMFSRGKLARVAVVLATQDDTARETYGQVRELLINKYGQPMHTVASYVEPFHEGDGYEAEAIRSGKGLFLTQWSDSAEHLVVNITPALTVGVTYESQEWAAEMERRRSRGAF